MNRSSCMTEAINELQGKLFEPRNNDTYPYEYIVVNVDALSK